MMKLPHRRQFLHLAAGVAALPALPRVARAQTYPVRPVRLIVGYPAGGGADILARLIGQWLSERLGQQFIIENRPGASGNIAAEAVAHALADGYTLLLATNANAINATLYETLNFNFIRDLMPVASIRADALVMMVNPLFPVNSVSEFIIYAKANPGKINMASAGNGSLPHVAGELFMRMTGINMVHVPYRSDSAAITDLLGGQVQVYFGGVAASVEYIRAGGLRALAVSTATRMEALPDVPALSESLPSYEASSWHGLGAPRNTPVEIIEKLNNEINAALADPKIKARFADLGATIFPKSAADFRKFIAEDTEKWGKVIRAANIRAD
jgi:tripartite-type tricarboxylate transporter receptor subunit TctC